MGIRGLSTYIIQNYWRFLEPFELQNTDLVVDGVNLYCNLYEIVDKQFGMMGAQYDVFSDCIRNFFESLLLCNVRPIVILDGILALTKKDYIVRFTDKHERFVPGETVALPHLMRDVFLNVLRELKIKFVQTITEADETMAAIAHALNCPILSEDGDFFMCTTKFIHFRTLNPTPHKVERISQYSLSCQMYDAKKLCNVFNDLNESLLPLALVILGNKYGRDHLDPDIMQPLVDRIDSEVFSEARNASQRRIENTLQWLSNYSSLDDAISAVIDWIDVSHRSRISREIKNFISQLGLCSPLALDGLAFPEDIISKLRMSNDEKLVMSKRVEGEDEAGDDELEYTEHQIIEMSPKWMIDDLSKGRMHGLPIELLMFSVALLNPLNENPVYPPTGVISLPILKFTYSLICSLRGDDENVLEIYSTHGKEIVREEVVVRSSSVNLGEIKKLGFFEKKRIIDEVLGVNGVDSMKELPNCWRLYTAAMVFWMRQEVSPARTRNHLFSVILVMVLGVIDEKIGFFRSKEAFLEKYGVEYKGITTKWRAIREAKEGLNMREMLASVTKEECIAAVPFFISKLEMNPPGRDWKTTVHTFTQFHSCLKNSTLLNSMLGYPYHPVPLHRLYNGLIFYKLFEMCSKQQDIEAYLHAQLQYSPVIVKIFIKLKDMILSMIEGGR